MAEGFFSREAWLGLKQAAAAGSLAFAVVLAACERNVIMTLAGVIDTAITAVIPMGSMLIANAMNTNGLALNRFRSDVLAHVGEIEAALALGADPSQSIAPCVQASFEASLIPAIDSLRSLGIVWIPGLMAGMICPEPSQCTRRSISSSCSR